MIWIYFAVLLTIFVVSLRRAKKVGYGGGDLPFFTAAIGLISVIILGNTFPLTMALNARLQAFFNHNNAAYMEVARLTRIMVTGSQTNHGNPNHVIDSSSWEQVRVASHRLAELRDSVTEYNHLLYRQRRFASNWFLGMWIEKPPVEIDYIDFKEP